MKISIITICFNSEKYIEQTILSVLNQNWPDLEYIIIDGGSKDKTISIIKKYEKYLSYWVSEPDRGISNAFNKGILKATGDWIGILNSDDFYEPDTFKNLKKIINNNSNKEMICGSLNRVSIDLNKIIAIDHPLINPEKPDQFIMTHPATFVKKETYKKIGIFDENYKLAMDYDFFLRAIKNGIQPYCSDIILATQRVGGRSQYFIIKALSEKYISLIKNGFNKPPVHYRMIKFITLKFFKIWGSRFKKTLGLSLGPDLPKNF